jgi:GT2 family glycosyltransferase
MSETTSVGVVVIGRNEGERLRACLRSVVAAASPIVYVDSGSVDGSPALAASLGADVVELDRSAPFSAARARNAGFERLLSEHARIEAVQFVDGDCEIHPGWIGRAIAALRERPEVSAVCGHVTERHPEASVYNRLCALEWRKAPGEIAACGGIFLVRAAAFRAVGGFRADVIAAEDDELCLRLRRAGGRILLVDAAMASHDADLLRFSQWWRRSQRAGHAYAQGAALHGGGPDRHFVRDCRRIWGWALVLPAAALAVAWASLALALALVALYPLQMARLYVVGRRRGWSRAEAAPWAFFTVLGKFPGLVGMVQYRLRRSLGRATTIIEHKEIRQA